MCKLEAFRKSCWTVVYPRCSISSCKISQWPFSYESKRFSWYFGFTRVHLDKILMIFFSLKADSSCKHFHRRERQSQGHQCDLLELVDCILAHEQSDFIFFMIYSWNFTNKNSYLKSPIYVKRYTSYNMDGFLYTYLQAILLSCC